MFIHPEYRGLRLARRLYDARKELCENLNLRAIIAGGRMPKYAENAKSMSAKTYIEKVKSKELYDPVLSFQLANDFHVRKLLGGYLSGDVASKEYATLIGQAQGFILAPLVRRFMLLTCRIIPTANPIWQIFMMRRVSLRIWITFISFNARWSPAILLLRRRLI